MVATAVILGVWYFNPFASQVYVAPETKTIEKIVEVETETLQKRIDNALTASSTDIETAAQAAYEEKKEKMRKEVELSVTTQYRKEIEEREARLEEQVSL